MNSQQPISKEINAVETTLAELIEFLQDKMQDDVKVVCELSRMMNQGRMRRPVQTA